MDMRATDRVTVQRVKVQRVKVWDGWIRLVHWSIIVLLAVSYGAIKANWMNLHYLSGYAMLALVLFRIAWGFLGSDTARFARFLHSPVYALQHLRDLPKREPDREIGHNAAGGWMVLVLLGLLLAQPLTGLFADSTYGDFGPLAKAVPGDLSDRLTGLHHQNFNLILLAAGLHIAAVLTYALVKKQDLVRPMITGYKILPLDLPAPRLGSPWLAATLLGVAALLVYGISRLG